MSLRISICSFWSGWEMVDFGNFTIIDRGTGAAPSGSSAAIGSGWCVLRFVRLLPRFGIAYLG